jgi:ATP-binding cassette subfamily B protein
VLISAGGTREPLDAVRYIGNRSSGRMGFAVAEEAAALGASVVVVAANVDLERSPRVRYVDVGTAAELEARSPLYRLLLSGAEGDVPPLAELPPGGLTPEAWPEPETPAQDDGPSRAATGSIGAPGGGSRGGAGMAAAAAPTPMLRQLVERLPPATGTPDVPADRARAAEPDFSLWRLIRPFRWPLAAALVLVAGDTAADLEAGTNAGAAVIVGVGTGGYELDQLAAGPHTHLLPALPGILDLL